MQIVNSSSQQQSFILRTFYSINTGVYVDDILTESVLAYWDVGVVFDDTQLRDIGEFGRIVNCSNPVQNIACPNFYDSNISDYYPYTLDPGESLTFELRTIARFEATAVPEPSTLALFAVASLGVLMVCRRRTS